MSWSTDRPQSPQRRSAQAIGWRSSSRIASVSSRSCGPLSRVWEPSSPRPVTWTTARRSCRGPGQTSCPRVGRADPASVCGASSSASAGLPTHEPGFYAANPIAPGFRQATCRRAPSHRADEVRRPPNQVNVRKSNQVKVRKSNQVNVGASRGSFLESAPRSSRTKPPDVVWGVPRTATRGIAGWRGRIRTFDLLIQSLLSKSGHASRVLSVRRASIGRRIGVSQVPIRK